MLAFTIPTLDIVEFRTKFYAIYLHEGIYIFFALLGSLYCSSLSVDVIKQQISIVFLMIVIFVPVFAVIRNSTGILVFCMAEPFLAIFASFGLVSLFNTVMQFSVRDRLLFNRLLHVSVLTAGMLFLTYVIFFKGYISNVVDDLNGRVLYAMPYVHYDKKEELGTIIEKIDQYTDEEDIILGSNLLYIYSDRKPPIDVVFSSGWFLHYLNGSAEAHLKIQNLANMLHEQKIQFVSNIFNFAPFLNTDLIKKELSEQYTEYRLENWTYWIPNSVSENKSY
jgi:hypothetical protein